MLTVRRRYTLVFLYVITRASNFYSRITLIPISKTIADQHLCTHASKWLSYSICFCFVHFLLSLFACFNFCSNHVFVQSTCFLCNTFFFQHGTIFDMLDNDFNVSRVGSQLKRMEWSPSVYVRVSSPQASVKTQNVGGFLVWQAWMFYFEKNRIDVRVLYFSRVNLCACDSLFSTLFLSFQKCPRRWRMFAMYENVPRQPIRIYWIRITPFLSIKSSVLLQIGYSVHWARTYRLQFFDMEHQLVFTLSFVRLVQCRDRTFPLHKASCVPMHLTCSAGLATGTRVLCIFH